MAADGQRDPEEELRLSILNALGASLVIKRKEAVAARASCGIEDEWQGDEEFYQGYDDANRHEFVNTASKPTESGTTSSTAEDKKKAGSTVFPNITQPYVDAVSARVGDMLLPTADRNFSVRATPIPDLIETLGAAGEMGLLQNAAQAPQAPMPPVGQPAMPGQPVPATPVQDAAAQLVADRKAKFEAIKAEAERKAKKAETQIDDWLAECQFHAEIRKVIDDSAKLGTGIVKGPVPMKRKASKWTKDQATGQDVLTIVEEIKPGSLRRDIWNIYPDFPACGENIHNGSFIWEYDQISERKLTELKGLPGYISNQIDLCLKEGAIRQSEAVHRVDNQASTSKTLYDIWYYHGNVSTDELAAAGCIVEGGTKESYPAMLTMVNDRVIRASLNPLDSGEFPYDFIPWKRRPGMPWGMGVGRQLRTPQRIVVGATRALMDNAGLASGPLLVFRRGVKPENGIWGIEPLKMYIEEDETVSVATDPVKAVTIPMLINELQTIIQLGMKLAEDVTGMPLLMQGQQSKAPDTVGGMTILNNNANAVLRRVARLFDSCITEPHIRRYYTWLMAYGEDDDAKGEFQIIALGSTALVERDIQNQEMVNVLALCKDPAYGKNPEKAMDEYLKSRRFDPKAFDYTDQEKEARRNQPPPEAPVVTAAKIREAGAEKRAQMDSQERRDQIAAAARMELNQQNFDASQAQLDRELEERLADKNLSSEERRDLEAQKVALANVMLKLRAQMNLSTMRNAAPQVATPAFEPAGRAQPGKAFQQ